MLFSNNYKDVKISSFKSPNFCNYSTFWETIVVGLKYALSGAAWRAWTHLQRALGRRKCLSRLGHTSEIRSHAEFAVAVGHFRSQSLNQNICANEWKILTIQFGEQIADVWERLYPSSKWKTTRFNVSGIWCCFIGSVNCHFNRSVFLLVDGKSSGEVGGSRHMWRIQEIRNYEILK